MRGPTITVKCSRCPGDAMTATDRSIAALLIEDIAAITSSDALKTWGLRWASEIQKSGARDKIAEAYTKRMDDLKGGK